MPDTEIYISTDIETDGPIPGAYSMLSFASAAYLADKSLVSTFSANLEPLATATTDPETMKFWKAHPEAWAHCRQNLVTPKQALTDYKDWLEELGHTPVFVAYPLGFDFMFVYWYLMTFVGTSPFGFHGIDVRSYAMAMLRRGYKDSAKAHMPNHWFEDFPHTHRALDDAIEQGALFCNMLSANNHLQK